MSKRERKEKRNAKIQWRAHSLVLLRFKLPPFYQVGYALRKEKTDKKCQQFCLSGVEWEREKGEAICEAWEKTRTVTL